MLFVTTTIADKYKEERIMPQTFEPQILDHPLIQHKISLMRKKETGSKDFRELASEVATLMCYEATRDLPLKEVTVETPICRCKTKMLSGRKLAIVPILRAGLGMVDGMLTLIPAAKVGHIGLYRDEETAKPIEYFCKLPKDISENGQDILFLKEHFKGALRFIKGKHALMQRGKDRD